MNKDVKIRNDNEYGDNIEDYNQHEDKNTKIKSLHHDEEKNIIHHHHVKEYDQIKLHDEYVTELRNRDQDKKGF